MLYTDNIGLKKPAYSDPADIADINENSDIIDREFGNRYLKSETYSVEQANNAIAQAIEALPNGLVYRGAVNYYKDLPTANNELGDTYSVKYQGETGTAADGNEYAWGEYDGTLQWIKLGVNAYTKDEIDEQHETIKSDILSLSEQLEMHYGLGTIIPTGADLNDSAYLKAGVYRAPSNAVAQSLLNCPVARGFRLEVKTTIYDGVAVRFIYPNAVQIEFGTFYMQNVIASGGVTYFGNWYKFRGEEIVPATTTTVSE
jgi:hypothetical protein